MNTSKPNQTVDLGNKCSCKGNNLDRLTQPAILTLLAGNDLHGYRIIQGLEESGLFKGQTPDNTGIYRTLHLMEERGILTSIWDTSDTGPAKKIYRITEAGIECLGNWINTLEEYRMNIETLLKQAKDAIDSCPD